MEEVPYQQLIEVGQNWGSSIYHGLHGQSCPCVRATLEKIGDFLYGFLLLLRLPNGLAGRWRSKPRWF